MLKKFLIATGLLATAMASQATIISHNGYWRAQDSNIVTGDGLEWLKWDVTKGLSISQARSTYHGWTLATNAQMAALFNVFQFGRNNWSVRETLHVWQHAPWTPDERSVHNSFIELFGLTDTPYSPHPRTGELYRATAAYYGSDLNVNARYNLARVNDDWNDIWGGPQSHFAELYDDIISPDKKYTGFGVALVREVRVVPPSQISLPGSLSLLALGFVALGFRRRKA